MNWHETFIFNGKKLAYNRTTYNNFGERIVEIPIAIDFLDRIQDNSRLLEIGNVLGYYDSLLPKHNQGIKSRRIVDKFEVSPGVENIDLMEISSEDKYDAIASISTVEHIGQGMMPSGAYGEQIAIRDLEAPLKGIAKIYDLLRVGGQALITVPYGKLIDAEWFIQFSKEYFFLLISRYKIPENAIKITLLKRVAMELLSDNPHQLWVESDADKLIEFEWDWPWPFANAIATIEMTKLEQPFALNLDLDPTPLVYNTPIGKNISLDLKEATFLILDRLRQVNLIVFLDWTQPEELIYLELEQLIAAVVTHPHRNSLSILLDTSDIGEEEAQLILGSILMNLCLQQNWELTEEPGIVFLGSLNKIQWKAIAPRIHYRVALKTDNQQAIVNAKLNYLPTCKLENLTYISPVD